MELEDDSLDGRVSETILNEMDSIVQNENNIMQYQSMDILGPQLSLPQIQTARTRIINFFQNNLTAIFYGTSSGGYTGHYLYKRNNKFYVFYMRVNGNHMCYNLTRDFLENIFTEYTENGSIILNNIPNYND